jgi:hypothetical protein
MTPCHNCKLTYVGTNTLKKVPLHRGVNYKIYGEMGKTIITFILSHFLTI